MAPSQNLFKKSASSFWFVSCSLPHFYKYFISSSVLGLPQISLLYAFFSISILQLKSPKKMTSSLRATSCSILAMVTFLLCVSSWLAARWQFINWNEWARSENSRLMAPLLPIKLQGPPARIFSFRSSQKQSRNQRLTRMAMCSPLIVCVATRKWLLQCSASMFYQSSLASQQKEATSERSHSWVPKKMRSGSGSRRGEEKSWARELSGGREPKRFQVMAAIVIFYSEAIGNLVCCSDYCMFRYNNIKINYPRHNFIACRHIFQYFLVMRSNMLDE